MPFPPYHPAGYRPVPSRASSGGGVAPRVLGDGRLAGGNEPAMRELALSLPVAGREGALANRTLDAGQVRAKTGTLPGVVSLAGYTVTADGRSLAFVVMADAVPTAGSYAARLEIDEFVRAPTACGCSSS